MVVIDVAAILEWAANVMTLLASGGAAALADRARRLAAEARDISRADLTETRHVAQVLNGKTPEFDAMQRQ